MTRDLILLGIGYLIGLVTTLGIPKIKSMLEAEENKLKAAAAAKEAAIALGVKTDLTKAASKV